MTGSVVVLSAEESEVDRALALSRRPAPGARVARARAPARPLSAFPLTRCGRASDPAAVVAWYRSSPVTSSWNFLRARSDPVTTASLDAPHPPAPRPPGRAAPTTGVRTGRADEQRQRSAGTRVEARAAARPRGPVRRRGPARAASDRLEVSAAARGARAGRARREEKARNVERNAGPAAAGPAAAATAARRPQHNGTGTGTKHAGGGPARGRRARRHACTCAGEPWGAGCPLSLSTLHTPQGRVVCARERRAGGKRAVIRVIRGGRLVRLRQATGLAAG